MYSLPRKIIETVNGDRRLLVIVLLINVAGSLFGFYYYWDQLMMTPWYLWPAVPDCPLYTFFMIFALLLILLKKPSDTLNTVTAVGLSMYGTWTVVVLLYFSEIYFSPGNALMSTALWVSHAGMALEGFLLLPYLTGVKPFAWAFTAIWFLALDAVDFFYSFTVGGLPMSTHPLAILEYVLRGTDVVLQAKIDSLVYVTFGLSLIFFTAMMALSRAYNRIWLEKNTGKKEIRT
jgi:uncharacterized membrane protein YpjA